MKDTEIWKPVTGHENYEVSSWGRVRSKPRARTKGGVLKPWIQNGYPTVRLRKDGKKVSGYIHQIAARAFLGPCPEGQEVRHLDTNRENNRIDNLAYGTRVQNAQDGLLNGKNFNAAKTHCLRGHEFSPENTRYRNRDGRVGRDCLTCEKIRNANRYIPEAQKLSPRR